MNTMTHAPAILTSRSTLEPLLTIKQLAALLQVHRRTIARLCRSGRLPAPIKVGNSNRWRLAEINKALGQSA